jgi:hypothetical protein
MDPVSSMLDVSCGGPSLSSLEQARRPVAEQASSKQAREQSTENGEMMDVDNVFSRQRG